MVRMVRLPSGFPPGTIKRRGAPDPSFVPPESTFWRGSEGLHQAVMCSLWCESSPRERETEAWNMYCAHAGAAGQTQSRMHTHASRHTRACTPNPTNRHQGPGGRDTESTRAATARWWAARTSARVKRRRFAALEHASISLGTRRAERARRASRCRASRLRQGAIGGEQRRRARAAR